MSPPDERQEFLEQASVAQGGTVAEILAEDHHKELLKIFSLRRSCVAASLQTRAYRTLTNLFLAYEGASKGDKEIQVHTTSYFASRSSQSGPPD